jgi:hypothetical protein
MREACKFNVQIHNGNILMSSVTKDPGVSSNLVFSGSGINFPRPLHIAFRSHRHLPTWLSDFHNDVNVYTTKVEIDKEFKFLFRKILN